MVHKLLCWPLEQWRLLWNETCNENDTLNLLSSNSLQHWKFPTSCNHVNIVWVFAYQHRSLSKGCGYPHGARQNNVSPISGFSKTYIHGFAKACLPGFFDAKTPSSPPRRCDSRRLIPGMTYRPKKRWILGCAPSATLKHKGKSLGVIWKDFPPSPYPRHQGPQPPDIIV